MLAACRTVAPPAAIDPALSAPVPPPPSRSPESISTTPRRLPSIAKLPPAAMAFLPPFAQARRVLIACDRRRIPRDRARRSPRRHALAPDIALSGAPDLIAAATAPHPPAQILAAAGSVAARRAIWIALRGGIALPLEGNLANVNNLLRDTEFVTLAVQPDDPADIDWRRNAHARCRTALRTELPCPRLAGRRHRRTPTCKSPPAAIHPDSARRPRGAYRAFRAAR